MSLFEFKPASDFPIPQLADLLTRGFEGYFVPINITTPVLLTMMRRDGIDDDRSFPVPLDEFRPDVGVAALVFDRCGIDRPPRLDESSRGDGDRDRCEEQRRRYLGDAESHRRSASSRR